MLKQISKNFREVFILEFTKELIRSTDKYRELTIKSKVKKIVKQPEEKFLKKEFPKKEQLKKIVHGKLKEETKRISQLKKEETPLVSSVEKIKKEFEKGPKSPTAYSRKANIPTKMLTIRRPLYPLRYSPRTQEYLLPETVRHIRPVPIHKEIDLGKLNSLINDPMIKVIECLGPSQKIFVSGMMGRKITPISLKKEEVEEVIKKFSESSRIPLQAGVINIAFGRLHLSSVISDITSPKFIIRKMPDIPPALASSYGR